MALFDLYQKRRLEAIATKLGPLKRCPYTEGNGEEGTICRAPTKSYWGDNLEAESR